jgi:hypothetical protein
MYGSTATAGTAFHHDRQLPFGFLWISDEKFLQMNRLLVTTGGMDTATMVWRHLF